ncbi:DUF3999 family protein [Labilibaculum sp.]|uniref:DUF3999 family protein n=1 Tax=Labilibaculum sp. TaxID=2060723 RepID=UPI0035688473
MKTRICAILFFFICANSFGQIKDFDYQREIIGVTNQWHKIELPNEIFAKLSLDLTDLRIIGITANQDTIEAPYLIQTTKNKPIIKELDCQLLNQSYHENEYFFTLKVPTKSSVNHIQLNFEQKNFDWRIKIQGSHDQQNWYTLVNNYRILAIQNDQNSYQYTELNFPKADYLYYRITITSEEKPVLASAKISLSDLEIGKYQSYPIKKIHQSNNKKKQESVIDIDLEFPVLLSDLQINIKSNFDYYRNCRILYALDSIQTEKGWTQNYQSIATGILNSFEKNTFQFDAIWTQHLILRIDNQDNQPLQIQSITAKGYHYELIARFTNTAHYFLCYGNQKLSNPQYDLAHFTNKIPNSISKLELGSEQQIKSDDLNVTEPLFIDSKFLWVLLGVIIVILIVFTLQLMKKSEKETKK